MYKFSYVYIHNAFLFLRLTQLKSHKHFFTKMLGECQILILFEKLSYHY